MNYELLVIVADALTVFFLGIWFSLWLGRKLMDDTVRLPWAREERRLAKQKEREAKNAREEWLRGVTVRDKELAEARERERALRKAEKREKIRRRIFPNKQKVGFYNGTGRVQQDND